MDRFSNGHCSFHSYQTPIVALAVPIADFAVSIDPYPSLAVENHCCASGKH